MGFLPSCSCVHTTMWMHHIDTNKTLLEKALLELRNYTMCCLEQILDTTSNKIAAVCPSLSPLINHPSKMNMTCGALLEKQGQTHKRCSFMDSCT